MHLASHTPATTIALNCPELLAPAGNWDCAKAAIENGADAIYFGLDRFNARMRAENFTEADLPELMSYLHRRGVKGYVTINTLIFPRELSEAEQYLRTMIAAGVDAAIVQDIGICRLIRHLSPDFPIHASTQMTITSAAGVEFAKSIGCQLVVLARECSLKEINKIQQQLVDRQATLPLEVFVHGALCVAYSGQCLTSEALGGRSANRGECAQACRMPYDLISDGKTINLGDRKYLLSPQDLAGLDLLPALIQAGITCLKIEGRLKSPEYVANVTQIYRHNLDRTFSSLASLASPSPDPLIPPSPHATADRHNLEMAFSRGLYTGWFNGINNQELVHAQFGKKRGVYLGDVTRIHNDKVMICCQSAVKPGDGIVFDGGHPEAKEEGGRIYAVEQRGRETCLTFGRRDLDLRKIHVGDKVWKTNDPELDRQLRQTFAGDTPKFHRPIDLEIHGEVNQPLTVIARDEQGHIVQLDSQMALVAAQNQPLTPERLQEQLGRLGNTPFYLNQVNTKLNGNVMLPISELNRLRREIVTQLEDLRSRPHPWQLHPSATLKTLLPPAQPRVIASATPQLIPLVRTLPQLQAALTAGLQTLYCELEDPRKYQAAVRLVREFEPPEFEPSELTASDRQSKIQNPKSKIQNPKSKIQNPKSKIYITPPRITKPGEDWILQQVRSANADGYLIRNYDHLEFFQGEPCIGDFSLNIANPLSADHFKQHYNLERLTASYDLNINQLEDLLKSAPPDWFEITIHQHMPMFHMEHCVFCAFLSDGTDFTNCGRPCEQHQVTLRDRVGTEHILKADAGCRNTVFNGTAQTGAEFVQRLLHLGAHQFRIEFVNETPAQVQHTIDRYQQLLQGNISGSQLWRELKLHQQLGVTRGTTGVSG